MHVMKGLDGQMPVSINREANRPGKGQSFAATASTGIERDRVQFSGQTAQSPRQVAETALAKIEEVLAADRPLSVLDLPWLNELSRTLGGDKVMVPNPANPDERIAMDGRLNVGNLSRKDPQALENLRDTLVAMLKATDYQPAQKTFDGYRLSIHNPTLAEKLQPQYTADAFKQLLDLCRDKGVFDIVINPKDGIVETAGIDQSEDVLMSQRWVTDSIRNGDLEKVTDPTAWKKMLGTLGRFYQNERPAFDAVFAEPKRYRTEPDAGVHHIFDAVETRRYPWLAPKRLESHGLALQAFCETIVDGLTQQKPWGFADAEAIPDTVLDAVGNLTQYFATIGYADAPTNGAWEELAFKDGLTSDVSVMHDGLAAVRDLMFNPEYDRNPGISQVRDTLKNHRFGALLGNREALDALIAQGERKVRERTKGRRPAEHPERPADAGLPFVVTSGVKLDDNPARNLKRHMRVLRHVEKTILRDNGLVRYTPFDVTLANGNRTKTFDGYLTPNWGLSADTNGRLSLFKETFERIIGYPLTHVEPSTAEGFVARARLAGEPGTEAEWFMIAQIARGYGEQLSHFLDSLGGRQPNWRERRLIRAALRKQTEFINRSFARITGEGLTKSNGKPCPEWKVPEAYQHVNRLGAGKNEPATAMLPGVNTPLAWAASSLYGAADNYLANLTRLEALGKGFAP